MTHILYKNMETGNICGFDCIEDVPNGLVRLTEKEVAAHIAPPLKSIEEVESDRLCAYAHPITGCDRYKAEADAERLSGNEAGVLAAEQKLIERREQIKKENPWPGEENAD